MKRTVVYISSCALHADGTPDTFLLQELPWLRRHFDRVLVCSGSGIAEVTQDRPMKIIPSKPACAGLRAFIMARFQKQFWNEIKHLHADHQQTVKNALKLFMFTVRGLKLYYWIQAMLSEKEQTTVYAYWMSYDGYAAALCKRKDPAIRAVARGHAFDIDIRRNPMNPYLMKRFIAKWLDRIYPINETAKQQIMAYADFAQEKMEVIGVGSMGKQAQTHLPAPRFTDRVFHVISCASMVEIKQIPLFIDTLANWDCSRLYWLHIGGGADEAAIRTYAQTKLSGNPMVCYELTGALPPEQVLDMYETQPFDVFVNTSKNEGTPVAIMEALHAGIPVVAPAVGGIPELVDDSIGCLYNRDGNTADILHALQTIFSKSAEEAEQMSILAQARWNERCMIDSLLPKLFPVQAKERADI